LKDALGLESGVVRLVEYDGRWPALFAAEARRIRDACGPLAPVLEHIGGTSVPGLCSKPVLDIVAGRPRGTPPGDYVTALERAGYEHRGERGVPGREFFCRGQPRAYHLHLVELSGPLWQDYLDLRDYLRAHPDAARRHAVEKQVLAARFAHDREGYMTAKSPLVHELLRRARGRP